jgi:hypothetical protein
MSFDVSGRIMDCLGFNPPLVQMVRPVGQDLMYTLWAREAHQWIVRGILPAGSSQRECVLFADQLINVMANMRCT